MAKDEIAEMGRKVHRGGLDVEYLKAVLVAGFEAGELPASSHLFPVLSRLLSFGPDDVARAAGVHLVLLFACTCLSPYRALSWSQE